ncbi:hypothetical protein NLO98_05225 [Pseudomonas syringae]|nr:hypothetical protein [Pseudomonas syringae]
MKKVTLLMLAVALAGCQSNVRSSAPTLLKDGVQLQQKQVVADAEHAKIIMRSTGFTYPVLFSVRRSADPDQRPEVLGRVVDSGRGKVFGWIAKMSEVANSAAVKRFPQLEVQADPGQSIEVIGESRVIKDGGIFPDSVTYDCGPMRSTFKPEKQKTYLVEFVIIGKGCEQHVYDVTQPNTRVPVSTENGAGPV